MTKPFRQALSVKFIKVILEVCLFKLKFYSNGGWKERGWKIDRHFEKK